MKNLLESKLITDVQWEEYQRLKELEEEHRQINGELRVKISNLEAEKATLLDILRLDNKIMSENEEIKEDLLKENIELENIRKKAIEYIKENNFHYMNEYALERFRNDLLNILQNGSEKDG